MSRATLRHRQKFSSKISLKIPQNLYSTKPIYGHSWLPGRHIIIFNKIWDSLSTVNWVTIERFTLSNSKMVDRSTYISQWADCLHIRFSNILFFLFCLKYLEKHVYKHPQLKSTRLSHLSIKHLVFTCYTLPSGGRCWQFQIQSPSAPERLPQYYT